jgi:hypothetical protein
VDTQKSPENLVRKEVVGELPYLNRTVVVAHIASIRAGMTDHAIHWSKSATILVLAEFSIICLMLGTTFFIQSRKRDFV